MLTEQPLIIDQDILSQLINISGRQRMLSQRIVLLIQLYVQNGDQTTLKSLYDAIKLFDTSHKQLTEGDLEVPLPGVFSERLENIFYGEEIKAHSIIDSFINDVKKIFNDLKNDKSVSDDQMKNLLFFSTSELLTLLNDITTAYELEAKEAAEKMQAQIEAKQHELATILHSISLVSKKANQISVYTHVVATRLEQAQAQESKDIEAVATQIEHLAEDMSKLIKELVTRVRE